MTKFTSGSTWPLYLETQFVMHVTTTCSVRGFNFQETWRVPQGRIQIAAVSPSLPQPPVRPRVWSASAASTGRGREPNAVTCGGSMRS